MRYIKNLLDPDTSSMNSQGFKPNYLILLLRFISKIIIRILRLNGRTRWSNEFIQSIDPMIEIEVPSLNASKKKNKIWFRTGHGRLYWRTRHTHDLEPETNEWIKSFNKSDVFYDIGANIGFYSLLASKFMRSKTYSFEPDLMNARLLYENIIRNNVSDLVTLIPIALSNKNYCANLFLSTLSYGDALHNLDSKNSIIKGGSAGNINIPAFTLDSIVNQLEMKYPTKIKIDVDGIELKILQGASKVLDAANEILVEWELNSDTKEKITKILTNKSFNFQWESKIHNSYANTVNAFFKKNENKKYNK